MSGQWLQANLFLLFLYINPSDPFSENRTEELPATGSLWNYKQLVKKLMRWIHNDEPPKWVRDLKRMRVGALASCRTKNADFDQYGTIIYIPKTSKSKKTTPAKEIPITCSTGFLISGCLFIPSRMILKLNCESLVTRTWNH